MRPNAGPALLLLAVAAGGCDSEQPALVSSQTVMLDFLAPGALTSEFRTWRMFEDSDLDGVQEDVNGDGTSDTFLWCEASGAIVSAASSPWPFTVTLKVVRAGDTAPTIIAQDLENDPARARYDALFGSNPSAFSHNAAIASNTGGVVTRNHPRGQCSLKTEILCNPNAPSSTLCADNAAGTCLALGSCSLDPSQSCSPGFPGELTCERQGLGSCDVPIVTRHFVFLNDTSRQRRSAANEELLLSPDNILLQVDPSFATTLISDASGAQSMGGVCPGTYLGPAQIDDIPLPMQIQIEKGATLIVEAKRLPQQPGGGIPFFSNPGLSAIFTVDGSNPAVSGNTTSGSGEDEFIQFFFQSQ